MKHDFIIVHDSSDNSPILVAADNIAACERIKDDSKDAKGKAKVYFKTYLEDNSGNEYNMVEVNETVEKIYKMVED